MLSCTRWTRCLGSVVRHLRQQEMVARQPCTLGALVARLFVVALVALVAVLAPRRTVAQDRDPDPDPADAIDYGTDIQPIFESSCVGAACHVGRRQSGVELTSYRHVIESSGDQYGARVVVPGRSGESPLVEKISSAKPTHGAPMPFARPALSDAQIARIARWIDEGARPFAVGPQRGDVDRDGTLQISDSIHILQYLFLQGPPPFCTPLANVDAIDPVTLSDAIYLLGHLFLGGDPPSPLSPEEAAACRSDANFTLRNPGCLHCHGAIENIHTAVALPCTTCHGGDYTTAVKDLAHVMPTRPVIRDSATLPLDYDLDYQRFVNPSNLRVVRETCGTCHEPHIDWILEGMMATGAGHYAGGLYLGGVVDTKTPIYGNFAIRDDDGDVPVGRGAVAELLDLIEYDPQTDQSLFSTHYRAVPGQACARCHLWSRGKGYRGAVGAEGTYRADGCAACHMPYDNDGRSRSADPSIDHEEQGHPIVHTVTRAITSEQCIHCHHRGARIGLSFTGRAQMPPRLPSGPGVPGTTAERFDGNFHYADLDTNPADVHFELGLECIDCHTQSEVMGDGNIYGHMDQATKIECETCHGMPDRPASLRDRDGRPLGNVERRGDGSVLLTSKVDGLEHVTTQSRDLVDPASERYNERAHAAMTGHHVKVEGGLECYTCHASWMPNCFGCHFERDERVEGRNLLTGESELGEARTANKVFASFKHFAMGLNAAGKFAPYIVGCQPIADVTAADGTKKLDFVMPRTSNGLSGLALNPVNPHTTRAANTRSCAECHRSPASLGLGSGNYSLARTFALAAAVDGVRVFDRRSDPASPALTARLAPAGALGVATLPDVVSGQADFVYVASGPRGIQVYDLRNAIPGEPVTVVEGIDAIDVSRAAHYLYVVERGVGVAIYANRDPTVLERIATVPVPNAVRTIPWGIHLLVASGEGGLVVVDISEHSAPRVVRSIGGMNAVDVRPYAHYQDGADFAARAYVADPDFGVRVVDLLPDAARAALVDGLALPGTLALDTYTRYLRTDGVVPSREHDYLYVAAGALGLHVFDISRPDAIEEVGTLSDLGGRVVAIDVVSQMSPPGTNDHAYLANEEYGLQLVDVADPRSPRLVATVDGPGISRVFVEVQQLDRFIDEQGNPLKENSHPGAGTISREDIVRILGADLDP